jgi:hypothetical protein
VHTQPRAATLSGETDADAGDTPSLCLCVRWCA